MLIHTGTLGKAKKYGAGDKKVMMGRCWDDWITRDFSGNILSCIQSDCSWICTSHSNFHFVFSAVKEHAEDCMPTHVSPNHVTNTFWMLRKRQTGEAFCVLLIMHDFCYSRNIQFTSPTEYFIHCAQQQISAPLVWKWFSLQRLFRAQGFPGGSAPYMNRRLGGIAKDFSRFFCLWEHLKCLCGTRNT